MRKNVIETIMGGVVLVVAAFFVVFAFTTTDVRQVSGYEVSAQFDNAAGLTPGTDVRMSGVKIGTVLEQRLDPDTYFADVRMSIADKVKLPADTSARVVSDGLLGNNFVDLVPGGAEEMIEEGGRIRFTQGAINLVDLIGRFIFSGAEGAAGDIGATPGVAQ